MVNAIVVISKTAKNASLRLVLPQEVGLLIILHALNVIVDMILSFGITEM